MTSVPDLHSMHVIVIDAVGEGESLLISNFSRVNSVN